MLRLCVAIFLLTVALGAQETVTQTRDPKQTQDEDFAQRFREWTGDPHYGSPIVDHLPLVTGVPTPKDVLGYHIGAPRKLTYYADMLRYYRALEAASPNVKVETVGRSDEGRELVVVWVSSEQNIKALQQNRDNLAKIADPRGLTNAQIEQLIATTKPHYHFMGGLHSGETGPSEMLMELVYRLAVETSPLINQIRNNVYVSVTPAADADGRDRNVDWFYQGMELGQSIAAPTPPPDTPADQAPEGGARGGGGTAALPYWGKYVYHDNNRDINIVLTQMRAITDWYFTAHPPIMHDLHEAQALMYTYSGGPPQNPNLDPLLFAELPWFSNWELSQMTKWGMPGVYTHAFMDGWSPGYLGSVAYNHNGMMRMYETQSGRDAEPAAAEGARRGNGARGVAARGGVAPARGATAPTGRGGTQDREWYRGIPVPPNAAATFSRRDNVNYMETGVLSALQLTSMFPNVVVENFYVKTQNSIEEGKTKAPFGFVIPVQRDMTKAAELVNILRAQGIEVGEATAEIKIGDAMYPAGSYVIKRDQPYGRLAKNLLEKQVFPDSRLTTYDDSGWTMGLAMLVNVKEVSDASILKASVAPVTRAIPKSSVRGSGSTGFAVADYGSNNMIAFRYKLRSTPMKIAEEAFTLEGVEFPAGSFVVTSGADPDAIRAAVQEFGLTAAALSSMPDVRMHDADTPRVAIFSQWSNTQDLGWYRLTFDRFGIPYDLIYKERVVKGDLKADYDVIVMAAQTMTRQTVLQAAAARPTPYKKTDSYKFLGMYGETADITGGFGEKGVEAFEKFLDAGGTLIAGGASARFPIDFGWAHTVDTEQPTGLTSQRPIVDAEIERTNHPIFYGYSGKNIPIKYTGGFVFRVGVADQPNILARYVGGDASVLSGLMTGADALKQRAFVVDVPAAHNGKGRVILFANNPIYRWQNHGEFNMMFNAIMNWNDAP